MVFRGSAKRNITAKTKLDETYFIRLKRIKNKLQTNIHVDHRSLLNKSGTPVCLY